MEKRNIQILIVEDNDFDYALAERNLTKTSLPYTFFFQRAQTEKEFREKLTKPTDIILSDFSLPSFSGLSALKIAHKEYPHIPFVFLSGTIGEEMAVETMRQGAIDYVLKDRMNKLEPAIFRALNEANEKLKRKEAEEKFIKKHNELKEFVYRISHDIRGPICTMQGMVALLRTDKTENKEAYLDRMNEVLLKMDGTVGNLSNFQFLYSDQLSITKINLKEVMDEVMGKLSVVTGASKINFTINIKDGQTLYSDKELIHCLLYNTLHNAISFSTPKNSKNVSCSIELVEDKVNIVIEDNGIGIPASISGRVFDMFFRGSVESKGVGLGLYIVKSALDRINGTIKLISEEGQGTKAIINFPISSDLYKG